MSITINDIVTNLNSFIGDASTDRITAAERLQFITEATIWLQESLLNDTQNATYTLNYLDNVHSYKVTSAITDLLEGADLRRSEDDQGESFAHKSSREMAEEIGQEFGESSWAIERRDSNWYLVVNHQSKYSPLLVVDCESTTSGGGTWALDTTNGDGTTLTIDTVEFKQGSGCFNFDADVSQTANNKVEIGTEDLDALDLSEYEDLASWVFWVYIPESTNFSSITLYWGSSTSAYWSATVTTDIDAAAWADGWNRVKINWADATKTSTPDETAIDYMQVDFNYAAGYTDDTDFRLDDIVLVRPEKLTFHYISWNVGDTSASDSTKVKAFAATTNVPYFSGQYDQYKYAVAHKAASLIFSSLRLKNESETEMLEAMRALQRAKNIIPSSKNPEIKSFKVRGVNLTRNRRR